jgi:hypothetical protein
LAKERCSLGALSSADVEIYGAEDYRSTEQTLLSFRAGQKYKRPQRQALIEKLFDAEFLLYLFERDSLCFRHDKVHPQELHDHKPGVNNKHISA